MGNLAVERPGLIDAGDHPVQDQAVADRVDVLVRGDDLAPVGDLAHLVVAELLGLRDTGAGAGGGEARVVAPAVASRAACSA
ncbi:hypothetical protein ACWEKJ_39250 [Amycolatopsis thermoflava]